MGNHWVYLTTGESRMPKTLEELKKENEKVEEQAKLKAEEAEELEENLDDADSEEEEDADDNEENLDDDEDEEDDKDKEKDKKAVVEPWMDPVDPDKKEDKDFVPVGAHVEMKNKLRGRLSEKDEELEKLKAENAKLKVGQRKEPKVRPDPKDFTDQAKFDAALNDFKDWEVTDRMRRVRIKDDQDAKQKEAKKVLTENVDKHYDRAATLLTKSGISPELFKNTDQKVRKTVEALMPGMGDVVTDSLISTLGKGSEKVMYYLGVNETALNKFQSLLVSDPTGLQAAVYLGQEKQRLTIQTKNRSNAPAPAKQAKGDQPKGSERGLKRKYDAAHKKGDLQTAYNLKQQAKKAGVRTSVW